MMATRTVYQLWEGGNAIGGFDTRDEALAVVRQSLEQYGPDDVLQLTLWSLSSDRKLTLLADGEALLQQARLISA
jgi:hypothetical protein